MTALVVNPTGTVSGLLNAAGCNIAVYYNHLGTGGTVKAADISGANYFGVLINGDAGPVSVDVLNSTIRNVGEVPLNGAQHGVGVYVRAFSDVGSVTGKIAGNNIYGYQKGGIVANGQGSQVQVTENTVTGSGHITFIAQNGIQLGYGTSSSAMKNTVSGNSYIGIPGDGSASAGILVVGGRGYGLCPDGKPCPLTVNAKINDNILTNNDVGVYLSNYDDTTANGAPKDDTNIKVVNNTIASDSLCYNSSYQTGVSDVGNNDKIINNKISGYSGCFSIYNPGGLSIDASEDFTNRPKVHANEK
jgi:hypothetical protein